MITKYNKPIVARYKNSKSIVMVYQGYRLIWELVVSCFGKGVWIDDKPWTDNVGWCD